MKITRTIELEEQDRLTVIRFLNLVDKVSDVARCNIDDVFFYFADRAELTDDGYSIGTLHQIEDIAG